MSSPTKATMRSPTRVAMQPAQQRADRQRDQKRHQHPGRLVLVHTQHTLAEQLHVDQRHHQRRAGGERSAQSGQERPELHPGGVDQPGAREALPHENATAAKTAADHQRQPVARQRLLAVRVGVVQPDDRETEGDGQQQATDHVDLLRRLTAVVRRQAELDQRHREQGQRDIDPEHVTPVAEQPDDENAVERAQHAAQLLRGADTAEHGRRGCVAPTNRRPGPG